MGRLLPELEGDLSFRGLDGWLWGDEGNPAHPVLPAEIPTHVRKNRQRAGRVAKNEMISKDTVPECNNAGGNIGEIPPRRGRLRASEFDSSKQNASRGPISGNPFVGISALIVSSRQGGRVSIWNPPSYEAVKSPYDNACVDG